jgi:hypothetical protein
MSIALELVEQSDQIRVRVDKPGVAAVSDTIDPVELISAICEKMHYVYEVFDHGLSIEISVAQAAKKPEEKPSA